MNSFFIFNINKGGRDGAVVRALSSLCSGPRSIPGPDVTCGLSLLLVLVVTPSLRVFLQVSPVFLPPQKPIFQIPIQPGNSGRKITL